MCQCMNKFVLVAVNIIFLLAGMVIAGIAVWIIVSKDTMFNLVQLLTKDVAVDQNTLNNYMNSSSMLLAAAYIVLVFGCISIIIGFCGCCGALKESSCLLMFYAVAISIVLVAEIVGAILAAVFKNQIGDNLKPRLITLEREHFLPLNVSLKNESADAVITAWINYAQTSFECCGVTNQSDITAPDTLWSRSDPMYNGRVQKTPVTCCRMKANKGDLLMKQDWRNAGAYLEDPNCPNSGEGIVTESCYTKIQGMVNTYSLPLIIVCIVVGLCEIICVIMACSLIQKIRNDANKGRSTA